MEFRQLLYVVELAREKNFSRAAKKLHVAQPSLSQQLSKLERELGVTLFHRSTSSVELTYAGATFVEKAQKVLDLLDQMRQEMDDISQLKKGSSSSAACRSRVPTYCRASCPNLKNGIRKLKSCCSKRRRPISKC